MGRGTNPLEWFRGRWNHLSARKSRQTKNG